MRIQNTTIFVHRLAIALGKRSSFIQLKNNNILFYIY